MKTKSIWIAVLLVLVGAQPVVASIGKDAPAEPVVASAENDAAAQSVPSRAVAVSGDSLIHSGDRLRIEVYREPDLSGSFTVDTHGNINYPLLSEIYLDGLSIDELKEFMTEKLGKEFIVDPQIRISIEDSPNKSVAILGSVAKPGNYVLGSNTTLVRLVSQVGGFAPTASTNNIKVLRADLNGKKVPMLVDVDKIIAGKQDDFLLQPGDFIYVEQAPEKTIEEKKAASAEKTVTVLGQVGRPGNYLYAEGMTLVRLIAQAGSFTAVATTHNVRIVRASPDGINRVLIVDASKIMAGRAKDVPVEPSDLIVVQESFF